MFLYSYVKLVYRNNFYFELNFVDIIVNPINDAPVLGNFNDIIVNEGNLVEVVGRASDADGDNLIFSINDNRFSKEGNVFIVIIHIALLIISFITINIQLLIF